MGGGLSSQQLVDAVKDASEEDLRAALAGVSVETSQKLNAGLSNTLYTDIDAMFAEVEKVKAAHPENLCAKHLDKEYFKGLSAEDQKTFWGCVRTGLENADSGMGCYAMTPEDYTKFKPFFGKVRTAASQAAGLRAARRLTLRRRSCRSPHAPPPPSACR